MKKLNLILTIIVGISMLSCSSDDENSAVNTSDLIGTWYGISSTFNGNNSGVPDNNILKFTENNRVEFIYEGFGTNGENISEFGNWSENGNVLTIYWDDSDSELGNYVLEILELNDSTLKWSTEITGEGTLIETFSRSQNATIDISQFPDYELKFRLETVTMDEPYEFQVTFMTTNGNNQIIEDTQTYSGINCCTDTYTIDSRIVKEYKLVGVRVTSVTTNVNWVNVTLTKQADQNEVMDETGVFEYVTGSVVAISYDFDTNTSNVIED